MCILFNPWPGLGLVGISVDIYAMVRDVAMVGEHVYDLKRDEKIISQFLSD